MALLSFRYNQKTARLHSALPEFAPLQTDLSAGPPEIPRTY
jgi:hypothetical protein